MSKPKQPQQFRVASFRYLVVCESVMRTLDTNRFTVRGIIDHVLLEPGKECNLFIHGGAWVDESSFGKTIELQLGPVIQNYSKYQTLVRQKIERPPKGGPIWPFAFSMPMPFRPTPQIGSVLYFVRAIDCDGAFGSPGRSLSEFRFMAVVRPGVPSES